MYIPTGTTTLAGKRITSVRYGKAAPRSDGHTPIPWERVPEARVLFCSSEILSKLLSDCARTGRFTVQQSPHLLLGLFKIYPQRVQNCFPCQQWSSSGICSRIDCVYQYIGGVLLRRVRVPLLTPQDAGQRPALPGRQGMSGVC